LTKALVDTQLAAAHGCHAANSGSDGYEVVEVIAGDDDDDDDDTPRTIAWIQDEVLCQDFDD